MFCAWNIGKLITVSGQISQTRETQIPTLLATPLFCTHGHPPDNVYRRTVQRYPAAHLVSHPSSGHAPQWRDSAVHGAPGVFRDARVCPAIPGRDYHDHTARVYIDHPANCLLCAVHQYHCVPHERDNQRSACCQ